MAERQRGGALENSRTNQPREEALYLDVSIGSQSEAGHIYQPEKEAVQGGLAQGHPRGQYQRPIQQKE